ncbi:MAG: ATP-binding cassette domain-containing protein [Planctomycetaceae bacterium]|nr:ATP-binding cassette domain-containing protein [Planctomycetaceae bacterium]
MSIVVRDLRRDFGALRAVDGVSFDLSSGAIIGLIGPNGSGKSTILRMLATFLRPSAGQIFIGGHDAVRDPAGVRRLIGYLPEELPAYSDARVDEFLEFRARLKGIARKVRRMEIDRCLAACDLVAVRRRLLGKLSQGYRRRAGLADALLTSPPVLLLDEPTIGLDPLQVRQTREVLRAASAHATILLSTHLLPEAQAVCDRVLMVVKGKLVSDVKLHQLEPDGSFEITVRAPQAECVARLRAVVGAQAVEVVRGDAEWVTLQIRGTSEAAREQVVRFCVARDWGVRELRTIENDLESHFVRVTLGLHKEAA